MALSLPLLQRMPAFESALFLQPSLVQLELLHLLHPCLAFEFGFTHHFKLFIVVVTLDWPGSCVSGESEGVLCTERVLALHHGHACKLILRLHPGHG